MANRIFSMLSKLPAIAGVALILLSAATLAGSWLAYGWWKSHLDALAVDGQAEGFNLARYRSIVAGCRWGAALLLVAGAGLWAGRRRLGEELEGLLRDAGDLLATLYRRARRALRAEDGWHLATCWGLVLGGIGWRLFYLQTPMRGDEAFTFITYASRPFWVAISHYSSPNNHLLHTLLVQVSCALFGEAPWAVRLPALAAGILVMPAAYVAVRLHFGKNAAILTLAATSAAPALIRFATNARGYSLVVLAFLVLLALAAIAAEGPRTGLWGIFAAVVALGFFAVPTMLYPLATVVCWLATSSLGMETGQGRRLRWGLAAAVAGGALLALALYGPALMVSGPATLLRHPTIAPRPWGEFAAALPSRALDLWRDWGTAFPPGGMAVLAAGFLVAAVAHRRVVRRPGHPALAVLLGCLPILLLQRVDAYSRVWLFLLPLYFGMAFAGLLTMIERLGPRLRPRPVAVAAGVLWCVLASSLPRTGTVVRSWETGPAVDGAAIAGYLEDRLRPGDLVLTTDFIGPSINYYFRRQHLPLAYLVGEPRTARRLWLVASAHETFVSAAGKIDRRHTIPGHAFGEPALIRHFPLYHPADLYLLERSAGPGPPG